MIAVEGFKPETRRKIASLSEDQPIFLSALSEWHSDFPSSILAKQKAEERRLNDAQNKLAALNRNVNSPDDRMTLGDIFVPGDDTVTLLTIEFLGKTGIIDSSERQQALESIRSLRPEFDNLPSAAKPKYSGYLGELATREIEKINEEVVDFYGPYTLAATLTAFEHFVGFTIHSCIPEAQENLQRVS